MANYNAPWNKGLRGTKLSEETRQRMSLSHAGTKKSLEVRKKISESQLGIPKPNSGVLGSKHHNWNPNKTEFRVYRREVDRLTARVFTINRRLINPQSFPRTRCGVEGGYQLDHRMSVKEGFEKKIPACEIAHINNLQMMPWKANRAKGA